MIQNCLARIHIEQKSAERNPSAQYKSNVKIEYYYFAGVAVFFFDIIDPENSMERTGRSFDFSS